MKKNISFIVNVICCKGMRYNDTLCLKKSLFFYFSYLL
jgi:hypothetical protein